MYIDVVCKFKITSIINESRNSQFPGEINFFLFSVNSGMPAVIANILQLFSYCKVILNLHVLHDKVHSVCKCNLQCICR